MDIKTRNRVELKAFFRKNSIPTEGNFADFVDATVNMADDGISKLPNNPLSIEAAGDDTSQKRAINFFDSFDDEQPAWTLSLNPRSNPADASTAKKGFSVSDAEGNSHLYIEQNSGRVGLKTLSPTETLDVNGRVKSGRLTIGAWPYDSDNYVFFGTNTLDQSNHQNYALLQSDQGTTYLNSPNHINFRTNNVSRMMLANNGHVGIGTISPKAKLHIYGTADVVNLTNSGGLLILGDAAGIHLAMDNNEIMAKSNGTTAATLHLQNEGGLTRCGGDLSVKGKIITQGWQGVSFVNGWVNYGHGYNPAGYYKDSMGVVHLRGLVRYGTASRIFTLPVGYRPAYRELLATITYVSDTGRIDIDANGNVTMHKGDKAWISLDGITFRAK